MTEKEKPTLLSAEKVKRLCKSGAHRPPGSITLHKKEVFSDGWTRWVCSQCGQVKFVLGDEAELENSDIPAP